MFRDRHLRNNRGNFLPSTKLRAMPHVLVDNSNVRGVGFLASLPSAGVVGIKLTVHPLKKLQSNLTLSLYPLVSSRKNAKYMFLEPDADEATVDRMMARLGNESWLAFVGIATGKSLPKAPEIPLKTPVCVVAAGGDTIIPVELQEKLASRFGVKGHIMPGAPHDLMLSGHSLSSLSKRSPT